MSQKRKRNEHARSHLFNISSTVYECKVKDAVPDRILKLGGKTHGDCPRCRKYLDNLKKITLSIE